MKIEHEVVKGQENIENYRSFKCEIIFIEIGPDNSPGGEDKMVFKLKVFSRESSASPD